MLIEDLRRATQELATSPPSIAEAAAPPARRLVALLETLGERSTNRRAHNGLHADA